VDDDTDHVLICLDVPKRLVRRPPQPKSSIRWRLENFKVKSIARDYRERVEAGVSLVLKHLDEVSVATQEVVNDIAFQVTDIIVGAANETIGKKLSKGSRTAPWWTAEYNTARVHSQRCYELAKRSKLSCDWESFVAARKQKNVLKRKLKSQQATKDEQRSCGYPILALRKPGRRLNVCAT
jgi:hypothetical protein